MNADPAPVPVLDPIQARVLGCLVEKEATTPDAYPLTVNAAQVAANQKTAREPVMALEMGEVHRALRQLEGLGLVRQQFSSRAERYEHRLESALGLTRQQVVLLALLCLRGPQTVHELFARSERWLRFNDAEEVRHALERLGQRGLAAQLPRASGQREERHAHGLCGPVDTSAPARTGTAEGQAVMAEAAAPELEARVATLEAQVAELQAQLSHLRAALGDNSAGA
ncbi:MAG TPA: YceH family protein [Stenotrophomonas sp.]|nr:YceH family protein [Stenotrophomonas sp.]